MTWVKIFCFSSSFGKRGSERGRDGRGEERGSSGVYFWGGDVVGFLQPFHCRWDMGGPLRRRGSGILETADWRLKTAD